MTTSQLPDTSMLPRVCYNCGYDVRGIGEPYRCPECGRAFDPNCYNWSYLYPYRSIRSEMIITCVLFCPLMAIVALIATEGQAFTHGAFTAILVIATPLALLVACYWMSRKTISAVQLGNDGMFVHNNHEFNFYPWRDIAAVVPDEMNSACRFVFLPDERPWYARFRSDKGPTPLEELRGFKGPRDLKAFVDLANQHLEVSRQATKQHNPEP